MIIIVVDKQSSDRVIQGKQRGKSLKKNTSLKVGKKKKRTMLFYYYYLFNNN
jgi:hypothetical protein